MRHATILVAILAFVPLASATAQVPIRPGEQVRVTHPPICPADTICVGPSPRQRSVGTFLAWKADSLVVQSNGDTLSVPVNLVTRLDVSRGRKTNTGKGAGIGFLLGGVVGAVIGLASYEECESQGAFSCIGDLGPGVNALGGAIIGGLVGLVAGVLIGSATETDRWQEVPLDRLRLSLGPQRDCRFGFRASVRF